MDYQYLTLPADKCQLEAGCKDTDYYYQHGYNHYGHDYGNPDRDKFDVLSSGSGQVLLATKEIGSLKYIVIVKYPNVYIPKTNVITDIVIRYYHMENLYVITGQQIYKGTALGRVGNTISGLKHVHIEVDTDTTSYTYSPQVGSGCMYLRKGYRDGRDTTFNPADVFYIGDGQDFIPHPINTFYGKTDIVTRTLPQSSSSQKLILPINNCKVTASQYSKAYRLNYGMEHYGIDLVNPSYDRYLYGCGDGEVLLSGYDNVFGNTLIVLYCNVLNHKTNRIQDVVLRYFHMSKVAVKKGQKINSDTFIGNYGSTGKYVDGTHLHISADYDTTWFNYEAGLKMNSNIIKRGNDDTMFNPMEVFWIKESAPEKQKLSKNMGTYDGYPYVFVEDIDIPVL